MGNLVNCILRRSKAPVAADDDDPVWLSAKNGLPLFWLSLMDERDLGGAWERDMRAAHADPDGQADGLPPIRIGWSRARTMLERAEARVGQRIPALAPMFREWAAALRMAAGSAQVHEVWLDLGSYANFCEGADDFLQELRLRILLWHGDGTVALPPIDSVENDLTGIDSTTGVAFPRAMPEWRSDRRRPDHAGASRATPGWWENLLDWGMALLCAGTVLAAVVLGDRLCGAIGRWFGGVSAIMIFGAATWVWVRRRRG